MISMLFFIIKLLVLFSAVVLLVKIARYLLVIRAGDLKDKLRRRKYQEADAPIPLRTYLDDLEPESFTEKIAFLLYCAMFAKQDSVKDPDGENSVKGTKKYKTILQINWRGRPLKAVCVIFVAMLLWSSVIKVNAGEEMLKFRFGRHVATYSAGWYIKLPIIERAMTVNTQIIRRCEHGFQGNTQTTQNEGREELLKEAKMLTKDGKLLNIGYVTQYTVSDPVAFLMKIPANANERENVIRFISESAFREVVASCNLDDVLTVGKEEIQIKAKDIANEHFKHMGAGITVRSIQIQDVEAPADVKFAFDDVNKAKSDKDSAVMNAREYSNKHVADAEGEATKVLNEAESYAARRTSVVAGETRRIMALADSYRKNPKVVKTALYIEEASQFLPKTQMVIVDSGVNVNMMQLDKVIEAAAAAKKKDIDNGDAKQ